MLAQDQETLQVRSAVSAEDPRMPPIWPPSSGTESSRGNDFDVLTNGDQIFPAMLEAIDAASVASVSRPTSTMPAKSRTSSPRRSSGGAARRAVNLVDRFGRRQLDGEGARRSPAEAPAATSPTSIRRSWYSLEEVNYRTHRKILVVDGEVGFTGGVGVADHWLGHAQDKEHWRDTQVRIRGPIVRLIEGGVLRELHRGRGAVTPELDRRAADPRDDDGAALVVRSSPTGGSNDLKRLYLLSIGSARAIARHHVAVLRHRRIDDVVARRGVKRGVKIRILVEGDITDAMPVKYASRHAYDRLSQLGIEIYEYQPTMMHAKALVVDGSGACSDRRTSTTDRWS